jgi:nuclear-control-of-ATPase protein 2
VLDEAGFTTQANYESASRDDADAPNLEHDLEWLLVAKAATQTYGLILDTLITQTVPISDELWYWNDILGSYYLTGLYSLQTSPLRLYNWSRGVLHEVQDRRGAVVADSWGQFYDLVKTVVRDRNLADMQKRVSTPIALVKKEIREKRSHLEQAKMQNASGIGYLLSNAFNDET